MPKQHDNVKALREFQRWRRGANTEQPQPAKVGELIDWAIRVCEAAVSTPLNLEGAGTRKAV